MTTASGKVIDRKTLIVLPQEPLERTHRLVAILSLTGVGRRLDQGFNERRSVNGLLVAFLSPGAHGFIGPAPAIAHQANGLPVDHALIGVPVQRLDSSLRDLVIL